MACPRAGSRGAEIFSYGIIIAPPVRKVYGARRPLLAKPKKTAEFFTFSAKEKARLPGGPKKHQIPLCQPAGGEKAQRCLPEGLVLPRQAHRQAQAVLFQRKIAKHRPTFAERAGQRTAPRAPVQQALSPWAEARRQKAPPSSKSRKRQPSYPPSQRKGRPAPRWQRWGKRKTAPRHRAAGKTLPVPR